MFCQGLLGHSLQKCTLTFAHSFAELSQNFGGTLAELSRKYPLSADPSHQQGAHQRKSKHRGPWCLALAKPYFWKLGCCIWSMFLETSESNVRQHQRQLQRCASRAWYLAHLRKLGCYLWSSNHSPAGPPGGRGGGSP